MPSVWRAVRAGGFRTRYLEAGDPSLQTVVLLHDGGHGTDALLCWAAVIELLAGDHHVIAPDLLGWGGTDKAVFLGRDPYGFRIDHIAALLDVLDVRSPAHFVGASFGGSILLRAAADPRRPLPIGTVTSIAGTGGPWKTERFAELVRYDATIEDARRLTLLVADEFPGLDEHVHTRFENSKTPGHWESMRTAGLVSPFPATPPANDYPDGLRHATMPMLLIECSRDAVIEAGWSATVAAHAGNARRVILDAAHEPNIDQPALVVSRLREFFAGNPLAA